MYEIHVHIETAAPLERVFELMSDHESFISGPGARCTLTRPGKSEKNGLGAVREVDALGLHFLEEVTLFERPRRYDYLVRSISLKGRRLPFAHDAGWLEFSERAGKTRVDWHSRFRVTIPVLGFVIERLSGRKLAAAFLERMAVTKVALECSAR
ncbi:MAG TPA: SRPBCC family protein [Polyangiaceae bacterium]|jgi:hypothetical protein|nr:SRPBCC family protein [Polyangiaceae bacterium]